MKKRIIIYLLVALVLLLSACSQKTQNGQGVAPEAGSSSDANQENIFTAIEGGTSMEDAAPLKFNTGYHGKYQEGAVWFSFTTGEKEDTKYRITLTNWTVGGDVLDGYLVDKNGDGLKTTEKRNGDNDYKRAVRAKADGTADTAMFDYLEAKTTYYLRLEGKSKVEFSLRISDPNEEPFDTTAGRKKIMDKDEFLTATNQDDAPLLLANTRYQGKYTEGYQWIAFHTGTKEDAKYRVTLTNLTVDSDVLDGYLVDEYGNGLKSTEKRNGDNDYRRSVRAKMDGIADTAMFDYLKPDTTYYLRLEGKTKVAYSLRISDPNEAPFDTTVGRKKITETDEFLTATNQDDAPLLLTNTKYRGKYTEGNQWVAFRTGKKEDAQYRVTLENLTVGSQPLDGYLVDEYGNGLKSTQHRNGDNDYRRAVRAKDDGTADTAMFDYLEPDTTYYLRLDGKSKVEYVLTIIEPEDANTSNRSTTEGKYFTSVSTDVVPGTSQSFALNIPLGTKVSARYTDGFSWLAFTTNEIEDAEYYVTLINCSVGSKNLDGYLVDKYGNGLKSTQHRNGDNDYKRAVRAKQDGRADTAMFNYLEPNTTYYLRIQGSSKVDYTVCISSPSATNGNSYYTSGSLSESIGKLDENAEFYTGTNQNAATLLKTNTRYHGKYTDGFSWVAFTTGEEENAEYYITLENLTVGSQPFDGYLVDKYGNGLKSTQHRNGDNDYRRAVRAKDDGTADTAMFNYLEPNTTYYLFLQGSSKVEYYLTIGAPQPKETGNTIKEADVVFEVPFELNDTQVRFVADEAIFINEAEAKAALAPVADIILAHPGHPILLAGTTAQAGTQEGCLNLSNRRADAVKDMLVNEFGVPESQLITVGLGYELDPFVRGRDHDDAGNFVETEAAKNRRVVVLDAESDMGRQILGK